jgi:hypothetical protein
MGRVAEITFSHGPAWKALISTYIGTMPVNGDASRVAAQSMSTGPPPERPARSAIMAKVGAAARDSQPTAWAAAPPEAGPPISFMPAGRGDVRRSFAAATSRLASSVFMRLSFFSFDRGEAFKAR